jgi:hypothetical protein
MKPSPENVIDSPIYYDPQEESSNKEVAEALH